MPDTLGKRFLALRRLGEPDTLATWRRAARDICRRPPEPEPPAPGQLELGDAPVDDGYDRLPEGY